MGLAWKLPPNSTQPGLATRLASKMYIIDDDERAGFGDHPIFSRDRKDSLALLNIFLKLGSLALLQYGVF